MSANVSFTAHVRLSGEKRTLRGHWNLRKIEHRRETPEGDMQRRGGSGQSVQAQCTSRLKARKAPTAHVSGADPQEQLDRRTRELHEALERQAATAEILRQFAD